MPFSRDKLTKYTAYYRCPDEIHNFKIRIKFKHVNIDQDGGNDEDEWHTQVFRWQEKYFNKYERDYYGDVRNCETDLEKTYHEKVLEEDSLEGHSVLFTYVDEDAYRSEHEIFTNRTYLQNAVENTDNITDIIQHNYKDFDYNMSVLCSVENTVTVNRFEKMYIMVDLGEYVENIWIKNEQLVCIIKFNKTSKVLAVYPDFTTAQPYSLNAQGETTRTFYYFLENCSEEIPENIALRERDLMKYIADCKLSLRPRVVGDRFFLPPKNKLYVYLFFEILSAKKFEYSNVYVQYFIDLPEHWSCENLDSLKGATQTCHGVAEEGLAHFGHCFDVVLEYDIQNLHENRIPKTPYIYFEVISKASWERYRTEGLTYKNLPISAPGCHLYNLPCYRFDTQGPSGKLRRFFIGDCWNYKDITWIGIPKEHENLVLNKYGVHTIGTGELNIRVNVVHQSRAFSEQLIEGDRHVTLIYDKLKSSSLIKSVEQVLQAFKIARRNMIEVRKNL